MAPAPGERGEADSRNDKWAGQASGEAPGWGPRKKRAPSPRSAGVRPQRRVGEVKDDSRPLPGAGFSPGLPGARLCQVGDVRAHSETTKSPLTSLTWRWGPAPGNRGETAAPGSTGEGPFTPATRRSGRTPGRTGEADARNDQVRLTSATWRRGPSSSGVPTPGHPRSGALEPNAR